MHDIITIGAATRDVFLLSKDFRVVKNAKFGGAAAEEYLALGAKLNVDELVLSTGGGATNAAVTFARLGFETAIATRTGTDEPAIAVHEELTGNRVDTSFLVRVKNGQTAYSTLLTAPGGERTVLVYRGVSAEFTAADVPLKTMKTAWYYVTSLSGNVELLSKIIAHAKKTGAKIAVNPGGHELEQASALRALIKDVDVLLVNLEEAQKLAGLSTKDGKELATKLSSEKTLAVVTDGPRGAYAAIGSASPLLKGGQKGVYSARNRSVSSISRTGAGDAFGSGLVAGLAKGLSVEDSLRVGTLNAESVIQHIGAKAGIIREWPSKKLLDEIKVFVTK